MVTRTSTDMSASKGSSASTQALDLYKTLASIPVISGGAIFQSETSKLKRISIDYSIRDHDRLLKRKATQTFHDLRNSTVDYDSSETSSQAGHPVLRGPITEVSTEITWQGDSPSQRKHVILRTSASTSSQDLKTYIEIWNNHPHQLEIIQEVTSTHGKFVVNETFGYPTWNSDETSLVYVAESIIKPSPSSSSSLIQKHRYIPDFGEQLGGIRLPALFLLIIKPLNLSNQESDDLLPQSSKSRLIQVTKPQSAFEVIYGQPVFGPISPTKRSQIQIFCTGFSSLPDGRRVGLIYCQNRLTAIYELQIEIELSDSINSFIEAKVESPKTLTSRQLSPLDVSARSARVLDDRVYYISNPIGGPHGSCATLRFVSISSMKSEILVEAVEDAWTNQLSGDHFPGLYIDQLPQYPFLVHPATGDSFLATASIWGSLRVFLLINLQTGVVKRYGGPMAGSCTVLNTDSRESILATYSQTTRPPVIWIGTLEPDLSMTWKMIQDSQANTKLKQLLLQTSTQVISLPVNEHGPTDIVLTLGSRSKDQHASFTHKDLPVIIAPHGGPHSTSVDEFSAVTAAFALLGYSTAYINYPGSLGFGQRWVYHLIKHLGIADVESCKLALEYLISQRMVNRDRVFVSGGSHGGFITAHLTSRYPDLFTAACMRNPVVDLVGTAAGGSDIPDWSFEEADLPFPMMGKARAPYMIDDDAFKVLKAASPISQLHQVKTPTLLLLGEVDRRVSHQQGLAWYHGLKGRGIRTEAYMFPENSHPLSGIEAELTCFETIFQHFS